MLDEIIRLGASVKPAWSRPRSCEEAERFSNVRTARFALQEIPGDGTLFTLDGWKRRSSPSLSAGLTKVNRATSSAGDLRP